MQDFSFSTSFISVTARRTCSCVFIVFYPEGHQRDSRACFYYKAEAVKAPEEVQFSHCKAFSS